MSVTTTKEELLNSTQKSKTMQTPLKYTFLFLVLILGLAGYGCFIIGWNGKTQMV